jgi:hypothetical protein
MEGMPIMSVGGWNVFLLVWQQRLCMHVMKFSTTYYGMCAAPPSIHCSMPPPGASMHGICNKFTYIQWTLIIKPAHA